MALSRKKAARPRTRAKSAGTSVVQAGRLVLSRLQRKLRGHKGSYVAVDVDSEQWLVAPTVTDLLKEVEARLPGRRIYLSRVGEDYVYQVRAL